MTKVKVNGILARMGRIRRELYALSAEFGDVDNYFLTEQEETSNRVGRLMAEVEEWKGNWTGSL